MRHLSSKIMGRAATIKKKKKKKKRKQNKVQKIEVPFLPPHFLS